MEKPAQSRCHLLPNDSFWTGPLKETRHGKPDERFEGETVWLTQQLMAELFNTSQQNVSLHLQNLFAEHGLTMQATHKEFLTVRQKGKRQIVQISPVGNASQSG